MKFDCGLTKQERQERLETWHRWFAWCPIRMGSHDCRWLEYVWRKGKFYPYTIIGPYWEWIYKSYK